MTRDRRSRRGWRVRRANYQKWGQAVPTPKPMLRMIIEAISNFAGAIKEAFGFASKRTDLMNASDVKAAAVHQSEDTERAKDIQAVAKQDLEEVQKRCAE